MSNQSMDPFPTVMSSTAAFSTSSVSLVPDNSTSGVSPTFVFDITAANDLTSRANYVYSVFAALGFASACFLLYSFILTYRAQRRLAWLDCLLWAFCGFQLLLLLLSFSAMAHRPKYLVATGLGCAALSFTINTASLCGLLLLVLMAYVLTFDPPSHALLRRPGVCAALVVLVSVLSCLLLAGLRGPNEDLGKEDNCYMDRVQAGPSYAVAKFCLAFLIPYILQLGLLIGGCVRQWKSNGRFLSGSEEGPVFLTVTVVMFVCQLFYSVALLRAVQLEVVEEGEGGLRHRERAFLSVAEFVLFSGSCASLLLVLLIHRPCRESLRGVVRQLRDCCRSPGRTQTHRHIIAPRIEIAETLQDFEP
ncbi:uncharacterized protein [Centroberyx affinis]|uniref:uncharacterized protein n=1 Tax=Centroberyx affinis TaxID=166261 RepID=UPI003A5BA571